MVVWKKNKKISKSWKHFTSKQMEPKCTQIEGHMPPSKGKWKRNSPANDNQSYEITTLKEVSLKLTQWSLSQTQIFGANQTVNPTLLIIALLGDPH